MTDYTLVMVGVEGIQDYIFRSNRLRENIGASYLVAAATEDWVVEILRKSKVRHNLRQDSIFTDERIEDGKLDVEVLYMGGGNAVLLFRTIEGARWFSEQLSTQAIKDAPGLNVHISHQSFTWGDGLGACVGSLLRSLKQERSRPPRVFDQLGLGVSVMCQSTTLPAVTLSEIINDDRTSVYPISAEVEAKHQAAKDADKLFRKQLPPTSYRYPLDFDYISVGEYGLMAVIHADGDGMGKRIQQYEKIKNSRDYITHMRALSEALKTIGSRALENTIHHVDQLLKKNGGKLGNPNSGKRAQIDLEENGDQLPLRPLVFGGDDLTLVCDGRLGLAFALYYLRQFEAISQNVLGEKLTSSAGIAFVKPHYPFARAYRLAEELASSAKKYKRKNGIDSACLDWHFPTGGIYDDLEGIREREYTVEAGWLNLRPVALAGNELQTWQNVNSALKHFQGDKWSKSGTKLNALESALRSGAAAVKKLYADLPRTPNLPTMDGVEHGWNDKQCAVYDALELADFYIEIPYPEPASEPEAKPS